MSAPAEPSRTGATRITAEEPCLPPHTTPELRRFRRRLARSALPLLLLAAVAGAPAGLVGALLR